MEEVKAPEAPVVEAPKATEAEPIVDNRRLQVEKLVEEANNVSISSDQVAVDTTADANAVVETTKESSNEDVSDPLEKIKKSVQKRINKEVAKRKTIEEELLETKAELEKLKSAPKAPEPQAPKDNTPPTIEQVEAYIVKMREEGNAKEEIAATRYLIQLEKEAALKEIEQRQAQEQNKKKEVDAKQLEEWSNLQRDYIVYSEDGTPDAKSDMTLANEKGLLYKTALALYNDIELHKQFYDDQNTIRGFRRAVSDAYREIHQQGLLRTPKGNEIIPERKPRQVLADPSADSVSEDSSPSNSTPLSDAEKVREELRLRSRNRYVRKVSF